VNNKRLLLPVLVAAFAVAAAAATFASATAEPPKPALSNGAPAQPRPRPRGNPLLVRRLRRTVWRWQTVMGVRRAYSLAPLHTPRALLYWRQQARRVRRLAAHPPHKRGWLCIHRLEGSWWDGGDPYWGGLQMDRGFMRVYAPRLLLRRGWANRWSPLEQMWVAERAHRSGRGYTPWPSTASYCGLL
jgi:hypothetical protein